MNVLLGGPNERVRIDERGQGGGRTAVGLLLVVVTTLLKVIFVKLPLF